MTMGEPHTHVVWLIRAIVMVDSHYNCIIPPALELVVILYTLFLGECTPRLCLLFHLPLSIESSLSRVVFLTIYFFLPFSFFRIYW